MAHFKHLLEAIVVISASHRLFGFSHALHYGYI